MPIRFASFMPRLSSAFKFDLPRIVRELARYFLSSYATASELGAPCRWRRMAIYVRTPDTVLNVLTRLKEGTSRRRSRQSKNFLISASQSSGSMMFPLDDTGRRLCYR